jgi:polyphosphate kinase 2 (PPK2 family)
LRIELVQLKEWVKVKKIKIVVLLEESDAAGSRGIINRITKCTNPRVCMVAAFGTPTADEQTQWYFQQYVFQLPLACEIVLFDRS